MSRGVEVLRALITGRAIVLIKSPNEKTVDVVVGNTFSKKDAINSLASTLKAIAY